jgi:NAD(P)-dependent dehydrogenase (short-subunit alcohol dehydrogenase family)
VNHLAHFLLFNLLKDVMIRSSTPSFNSRVIAVSSQAHTFSTVQFGNYDLDRPPQESIDPITEMEGEHNQLVLYGQSKTANIWFANNIERLYGREGLHGLSVHPGAIVS